MKKIIIAFVFSLVCSISYAQTMQVTIQILSVYHYYGNDSPILRVSVDNRGYNFNGQNYGGFQTGGGITNVSNYAYGYDTYVITRSDFTAIRIEFHGWNDKCHNSSSTYWDYNDDCKCPLGPFGKLLDCDDKNDHNRYYGYKDINFWEYPNDGASSPMVYTGNNRQGITFRVSWTPLPPTNILTNLPSPEACGNSEVLLTATLPGWFTLPASVLPYFRYIWQIGIQSGSNFVYTTIATTTTNTFTYKAPSNAPVNGSLIRQFRVYTVMNGIYSLVPTQLNNPINIFPPPPIGFTSIINPNSCNGMSNPDGNIVITGVNGGVGIYLYSISDGIQTYNSSKTAFNINLPMDASNKPTNITGLKAGAYSVIVYNYYNGEARCSYTKQISITEPLPLTVATIQKSDYNGFNVSCNGSANGSASVSGRGGNAPYTYIWDDEITFTNPLSNSNGSFNNLKSGNYYIKIKDAKNCPVNPVLTTFTEPATLFSALQKTDVLCNGAANGKINITSNGGAGGYVYSLNNNSFTSALPFKGLAPGNYDIITKDKNNCTVTSANTSIAEPTVLSLSVTDKKDILCYGASTGSVKLSGSGGISDYAYSYNGTTFQTSGSFNSIPAGIYNLSVKDKNNCITSASTQFIQPDVLQNIFDIQNVTCLGKEDGSIKSNVTGGVKPYVYQWPGRSETADNIKKLYAGKFMLAVSDANNCSLQQAAIVKAPATSLLINSVSSSNAKCEGICDGSIIVNASGGIPPYNYYYNSIQSLGNVLSSACGGKFVVKVKDSYNCIVSDQLTVPLINTFDFDLPDSVTLCTGQTYLVDVKAANANVTLTSLNGFFSSSRKVPLSVSDQYYLTLSNSLGCIKRDTMVLTTSSDLLKSRFIVPGRSYAGDTINFVDLSWPRPDSVSWVLSVPVDTIGNDEGFIRLSYKDPGTYTIRLTAYMGLCRDSVSKTITFDVPPSLRGSGDSIGLGFHSINSLKLYPIPNSGKFIVEISVSHIDEITCSIINIFGEVIDTEILSGYRVYEADYDIMTIPPGVYLMNVNSKDDAKVLKFIVE